MLSLPLNGMLTNHRICYEVYQTFVNIKLYAGTYREATSIKVIENWETIKTNLIPRASLLCLLSLQQQRRQRREVG